MEDVRIDVAGGPITSGMRGGTDATADGVGDVGRLYLEFGSRLEQIVRGGTRAPDPVIEDACQVAWTRLVRHRDRVAPQTAPGWLTKTALHEAVKLSQRDQRELSLELEVEQVADAVWLASSGPDELVSLRERLELVRRLPRRQQRLLWLRAFGLSYEEMASRERCTNRTVQRQLETARERLRSLERMGESARAA